MVGHADPPLSHQGRADIAALLTPSAYRPDLLLSSDLRRSRESAETLAAHWGIEVVADPRLRELHFGEWEGRTWKELEQVDGARLERWMRDWTSESTPKGESFPELIARTSGWLAHWVENLSQTAGTTVVVAHAGSIRAILCQVLGVPLKRAFELEVGHARATCIDLGGATPSVVCRNTNTWPSGPAAPGCRVSTVDERSCPLCGGENGCAIAAGQSVSACWCSGAKLPREALDGIPTDSRGTVCICSRCAGGLTIVD